MTNLYDFLRRILDDAENQNKSVPTFLAHVDVEWIRLTHEDIDWLRQYMQAPDIQIHFKANKIGESATGAPIYAQDYAICGESVDVFSLLTEAMMANSSFASLVGAAYKFFEEHVPNCADCNSRLDKADPVNPNWKFTPHPVKEREFPCTECDTGELMPVGFTKPNGQTDYECNICEHRTSFP